MLVQGALPRKRPTVAAKSGWGEEHEVHRDKATWSYSTESHGHIDCCGVLCLWAGLFQVALKGRWTPAFSARAPWSGILCHPPGQHHTDAHGTCMQGNSVPCGRCVCTIGSALLSGEQPSQGQAAVIVAQQVDDISCLLHAGPDRHQRKCTSCRKGAVPLI